MGFMKSVRVFGRCECRFDGICRCIRRCPKSDLHNHFVLGGSRHFLREYSGRDILPIKHQLHSMDEMHAWNSKNIGTIFETPEGRRMLIQATFLQAKDDGVTILEIGEDVWGSFSMGVLKNL